MKRILKVAGVATTVIASILVGQEAYAKCGGGGNRTYHFGGKLEVGDKPLKDVQLRIVRKGSPLKWAQGPDATTDKYGNFDVNCQFARDRNGAIAGGKKIRFKVMARFRNSNYKVRKGGWFKNNWFKVADLRGCRRSEKNIPFLPDVPACKEFDFTGDDKIEKNFDTSDWPGQFAYLWWFYNELQDEMQKEEIGLTDRPAFKRKLAITYPNRNVRKWFKQNILNEENNSWFMFNIHLEEDDWENNETLIHEFMHRWEVANTKGTASLVCLTDLHHKAPARLRSTPCSGFMEGFAEATAQAIEHKEFEGNEPETDTHKEMREGKADDYKVTNLSEAQRSDIGWQNFLTALWVDDKGDFVEGSKPSGSCYDTHSVSVYEVLRALKREHPRKAKWIVAAESTFKWFTEVLEKQHSNFNSEDAKFYQLLGNPSLTASDIREKMCGGGTETSEKPLGNINTGYQGRAFVRKEDESIGEPISNVKITFTSEDGSITRTAKTGQDGSYGIKLSPGRYKVKATHPSYQNYNTGSGFFVVTEEEELQTGNIFLKPES